MNNITSLNNSFFNYRLVDKSDANFIISLRSDKRASKYLSPVSTDINDQICWIEDYKIREQKEEEFYIMCLSKNDNIRQGVFRIYNIKSDSFEIGSWLFSKDSIRNAAIHTDLDCRVFFFNKLKVNKCYFEVVKSNKKVLKYHSIFSPKLIGENESKFKFELDKVKFLSTRKKLIKLI